MIFAARRIKMPYINLCSRTGKTKEKREAYRPSYDLYCGVHDYQRIKEGNLTKDGNEGMFLF